MRVLLVTHAFPPRSTAGVEVYTLRLAQELRRLGDEVTILTAVHDLSAEPHDVRRRVQDGIPVVEIVNVHHRGSLSATYDDAAIDKAARALLRELQPECVHLQHLLNLSAGLVSEARHAGARVVLTLHDYWLSCPRDGLRMRADLGICESVDHRVCAACLEDSPYVTPPLQRRLSSAARRAGLGGQLHRLHDLAPRGTEWALRLLRRGSPGRGAELVEGMDRRAVALRAAVEHVDLLLAPTAFVRDRTLELGVSAEKVVVSRYGAVRGPTQPRSARRHRRRLGFIGTLAPHKGLHVLVEAFLGLEGHELTLDIHGSPTVYPSYVEALRQEAEDDPRIRFRGPFSEGGQDAILTQLDLLVIPSVWWENSPLTALEALAAGVPVVASRIGGLPEVVEHGRSGLLVAPADAVALREALRDVVEGTQLAEALDPLPLKTVEQGARELRRIYAGGSGGTSA